MDHLLIAELHRIRHDEYLRQAPRCRRHPRRQAQRPAP
jgi:hypothetical protein